MAPFILQTFQNAHSFIRHVFFFFLFQSLLNGESLIRALEWRQNDSGYRHGPARGASGRRQDGAEGSGLGL